MLAIERQKLSITTFTQAGFHYNSIAAANASMLSKTFDKRYKEVNGKKLTIYFIGKLKFNIRVVLNFGIEEPFALGKINYLSIFICTNIGLFKPGKFFQLFRVFAA
jgi:hypothetical protein